MINVLKKMITSKDYEVVSLGEQVLCNKERYIKDLEKMGYSKWQAEVGIVAWAEHIISESDNGAKLRYYEYREDLVEHIADLYEQEITGRKAA